jgi:hypothetical protein
VLVPEWSFCLLRVFGQTEKEGVSLLSNASGSMRNRTVERILESLQVACKNAPHGCKELFKLTSARNKHVKDECEYRPFTCPVKGCGHKGSTRTMPQHLTERHKLRIVEFTEQCETLRIRLHPSEDYVMVKSAKQELFLLHRREGRVKGSDLRDDSVDSDLFFCASFGACNRRYDIMVKQGRHSRACSMNEAVAPHIRDVMEPDGLPLVPDHLVFPRTPGESRGYDVLIGDWDDGSDPEGSESEPSKDKEWIRG